MKHLRENTLRQQTVARRIGEWTEPPASRIRLPAAGDYLAGFVRAAVQTVSPCVRPRDSSANWMPMIPCFPGWAGPFCWWCRSSRRWLCLFLDCGNSGGVNPWIKPIKFSMSFSTFASTVSLLLLALQIPKWQLTLARRAIATSVALEILSLGAQAWRSAYQLAGHSLLDSSLAQMTNSMVMVNTANRMLDAGPVLRQSRAHEI